MAVMTDHPQKAHKPSAEVVAGIRILFTGSEMPVVSVDRAIIARGDHKCQQSPTGAHHWILAPVNGCQESCEGSCKYCGAEKRFLSYGPWDNFGDKRTREKKRKERV